MLIKRWMDRGYFQNSARSLFISDTPRQEEAERQEFVAEGLELNFVSGSWYLGSYLGPQENLVAWVKTQVEACYHRFRGLGKISRQHPQSAYSGLGMSL